MIAFHFHVGLDDPTELVVALAAATAERDVRLLTGWNGCDRASGELIEGEVWGAVNIEWLRRRGRYALEVQVYRRDAATNETPAQFARRLAAALQRSILFSDCSTFGYSYFSAEPDGSIWAQLLVIGDDDERLDLDSYDHPDPSQRYPRMVFRGDAPLPVRGAVPPEASSGDYSTCEIRISGKPCRIFNLPCPKHRLAAS
ncbi:MAG: hypothetical protein JO127_00750 [Caulobacteraceae bacterium]|nr:hypothetical protein [Caulobacteraceae bacterium]